MAWTFNATEAIFIQIADRLRQEILFGKYRPDDHFPPVRQLAFEASVNPNTMQKALAHLEEEGLLYTKGTAGRFVTCDTLLLESSREKVRRDTVKNWLKQADALGISTDELIDYINHIKKEDDNI